MGNSSTVYDRRRNSGGGPQSENRYVVPAATPYLPNPNANSPPYYQYPGYYPHPAAMPIPMPAPYNYHHLAAAQRFPCGPVVEHQKAVTIRNDVNVKKETLRIEPDEENPGKYLVAFSFDAAVPGSVTLIFFTKEGKDSHLTPMKESLYPPITVQFQQGLAQKFKQPSGTGIDLSTVQEEELSINSEDSVYTLAIKAEASPDNSSGNTDKEPTNSQITLAAEASPDNSSGNTDNEPTNSQITLAAFEKDKEEYQVKVVKQILWVNGMRYELQEIFGIGNSVEDEFDGNDSGKECVVCLSEPRDTTVLPCRHMCMCSACAKVLRFQTNRCPICRQPVERLLEIKVSNGNGE